MEDDLPDVGDTTTKLGELIVGDEPWSTQQIFSILKNVDSELPSTNEKLLAVAIRLELPVETSISFQLRHSTGSITIFESLFEIVEAWRQKYLRNARLQVLVRVLDKSGLSEFADALRNKMTETQRIQSYLLVSTADIVETTKWDELSDDLKLDMGNKMVSFQGTDVPFNYVGSHLMSQADNGFLKKLALNETPEIVPIVKWKLIAEYIKRNVCRRTQLTQEVFKYKGKDVFVFEGIREDELSALIGIESWSYSGNKLKQLTVRFIIMKHQEDFGDICILAAPSTSVHWVRLKNSHLEWVKTYGSTKTMKKYIADKQDIVNETQLLSDNLEAVIISDSPGTGKTDLLKSLANKVMQSENRHLVLVIDFYELMNTLKDKKPTFTTFLNMIAMNFANTELGRKVVLHHLKTKSSFLMLDGFDNLPPFQISLAGIILKGISKMKNVRLFVTTQQHLKDELEEILQTHAYTIEPLAASDQCKLILGYWLSQGIPINENIRRFAEHCRDKLAQKSADCKPEIFGLPLLCRMFSALNRMEASSCSTMDSNPSISTFETFDLFRFDIDGRLTEAASVVQSKLDSSELKYRNSFSTFIDLKQLLELSAIQLLHPEIAGSFKPLHQSTSFISLLHEVLTSVQILRPTLSGGIRFLSRTFAEYFFAGFVFENHIQGTLRQNPFTSENFSTTSKTEVIETPYSVSETMTYFQFKQPTVSYFLSSLLRGITVALSLRELISTFSSVQGGNLLIASAFHNFIHCPVIVAKTYLQHGISNDSTTSTNALTDLLLTTAKYSDVELMKILFSKVDISNMKKQPNSYPITPLHIAAKRGYYNLVEYLVKNKYDPECANLKFLLHFCTFDSIGDDENQLSEKKKIIKLLLTENSKWQEEKLNDGSTPLLQSRIHSDLVRFMIELGFAVNILDDKGNTVLHKLVDGLVDPDTYHIIVVAIRKRGFMHFNKANCQHKTPLHCAAKNIDVTEHTLKIFESEGASFNSVDDEGKSVLLTAIHGGRSKEFISLLEKLGAKEMVQEMDTEKLLRLKGTHIRYDPDHELGHGSTSTVYKGLYRTTPAAVKKIKSEFVDVYYKELKIWRDMRETIEEANLNIITLHEYVKWEGKNGIAYFFAMELAICDLEKRLDLLKKRKHNETPKFDMEEAKLSSFIHGAAKGLEWMATLNILHRDIKPANILIFATKTGQEIAKLGDFGISRKISGMSTGTDSAGRGTSDWMAPEAIEAMDQGEDFKFNSTKAIDIFSLGMTAHYTISIGTHPFAYSKQYRSIKAMNIIDAKILPSTLQHPHYTANHLFQWMMKKPVKDRPKIADVVDHPFFWDSEKSIDFIREVAACLEQKDDADVMRIRTTIDNQYLKHGQSPDWIAKIGSDAKQPLFYFSKKYDTPKNSVMMLVELIRDKYMHRKKMIKFDKEGIFKKGASFCKKKYANYFQATFPDVVIHIFGVLVNEAHPSLGDLRASFYANFGTSKVPLPTKAATAQP